MKLYSFFKAVIPATIVASLLTACGGGGGGAGATVGALPTGTFAKYAPPTSGANYSNLLSTQGYMHSQEIFLPTDIQASGNITAISIQYHSANASDISCPNFTIRMGHNNLTNLTQTFANNIDTGQGGMVTVLSNATITFRAGAAGSFQTIQLSTPFEYNGVDNLVVEFERTSACSGTVLDSTLASLSYIGTALSYTSGSSTASVGYWTQNLQFTFSGGDDKVAYAGGITNSWPFTDTTISGSERPRIQNLYLASEIGGSGPITGIGFQAGSTTAAGIYTYSIKLGHSKLTTLTGTYASNYSDTPVTVANAVTFNVPANVPAGEWIWVPIPDGVFTYNGTDNLIVEIESTSGNTNLNLNVGSIVGRRVWADDYPAGTATTGTVDDNAYSIALRFNGGRIQKISADTGSYASVFNGTWSTAALYSATDLGTSGDITSVACRLSANTTAANYDHYKVVIGQSGVLALSGTAATDFISQSTAFSGTVSIPAGLLAGDWVDISLSTPFHYDGKSNLIIWMGNDGSGTSTGVLTGCRGEPNATRYPSALGTTTNGVGYATYALNNGTTDIRMTIHK